MVSIRRLLGVLGAFLLSVSGQSQANHITVAPSAASDGVDAPEASELPGSALSPNAEMAGTSDSVPNVRSMPEIPLLAQGGPVVMPSAFADASAPHSNAPHSNAHSNAPHSNAPHSNAPHSNAPHSNSSPHSNAPHSNAAPQVPEPATLGLLALGLGGLGMARRRRAKDKDKDKD